MRRLVPLLVLLAVVAAGCGKPGTPARSLVVGAVEDAAKFSEAGPKLDLAKAAGFGAVALSSVWQPGLRAPSTADLLALQAAAAAAQSRGIQPIVAVYQFAGATPLTPQARAEFATYAASIAQAIPTLPYEIVGNEPNLNLFWMPQYTPGGQDAAAPAYERLLAQTYDAIKAANPDVQVIGAGVSSNGSDRPHAKRQTHSPTRFLLDLGEAYRASGRTKPLMDLVSLHPYPRNSATPPTFAHPRSTTIGLADYGKLVQVLGEAFDGTHQRGSDLPVAYGEYGLQTTIPPAERGAYTGAEAPAVKPIPAWLQGRRYVQAIRLVACQPTVKLLLLFHVSDETQLTGLQSGVYYANDVPKPSLAPVAAAARNPAAGTHCG